MSNYHVFTQADTIAAIATPIGSGGIGIVRISGPVAQKITQKIFTNDRNASLSENQVGSHSARNRHLAHGYIVDPENGQTIDEVLLVFMAAPNTYTGENVAEIQCHSGPVVLARILSLVLRCGARLADPGEFTRRAFLNGRIDLSQAEAVADMINAKSDAALQQAAQHLTGVASQVVAQWVRTVKMQLSHIQAIIEFPEDIDENIDRTRMVQELTTAVVRPIDDSMQLFQAGQYLRDGLRIAIVGRPNVGKSSILNRLIKKEKAIVTDIPGTTRDLIEDYSTIHGIPVIVTDTAGLHQTLDPVEKIGIQKTRESIDHADLVLFIIDGSQSFTTEDRIIFNSLPLTKVIFVVNKIDLISKPDNVFIPENNPHLKSVYTSALNGEGIHCLAELIGSCSRMDSKFEPGRTLVPSLRQTNLLKHAADDLCRAVDGLKSGLSEELIADDLTRVLHTLEKISGKHVDNDVLDDIFNRFCIGK